MELTPSQFVRLELLKIYLGNIEQAEEAFRYVFQIKKDDDPISSVDPLVEPFNIKICDLYLSVRTYNVLKVLDIETLGDLCGFTKVALFRTRGFGRKSLEEVKDILEKHGLTLGMWESPAYIAYRTRYGRKF